MKQWKIWTVVAIVLFLGALFSLMSFWAAVDLGYDRYPGGKSIIASWSYAMIGLAISSIGCAIIAASSWRASRKAEAHSQAK
jgi:hypothetical protein